MSNKIRLSALAVAAATIIAASSAQATPTFYDNLTDFNNALGAVALTVEDFEAFVGNTASGTDFGEFTIETDNDIDAAINGTNGPITLLVSENSDDFAKFNFDTAITAFSIDLIDALDQGGGSIFVTIDGGSPEQAIGPLGDQANLNLMFIGVIDLDGFTMVTIDGNDDGDYIYFDNMQYGAAEIVALGDEVEVAEPGTLAMFGLGLAGLGYMRRRRAS